MNVSKKFLKECVVNVKSPKLLRFYTMKKEQPRVFFLSVMEKSYFLFQVFL